jgi:hypothetical protein
MFVNSFERSTLDISRAFARMTVLDVPPAVVIVAEPELFVVV